jgi:hypothetical protein
MLVMVRVSVRVIGISVFHICLFIYLLLASCVLIAGRKR